MSFQVCQHPTRPVPARHVVRRRSRMSADGGDDLLKSSDFAERIRGINEARTRFASQSELAAALLPLAGADPNPQVRYMAISQLGGLDASQVSPEDGRKILDLALTMLREDTDPSCQAGAADVVAALRLQDGFDTLVETFKSTNDWMLKFTICSGQGEMRNPGSFEFLREVLSTVPQQGEELLLTAIVGALGDLKNPEALPLVEQYIDHPDQSVKERAVIARDMLAEA